MEENNYAKPGTMEIKDIILEHLRAILVISRIEFTGGYWHDVSRGDQRTERVYVPDTRASYIQSVRALHDTLLPFFDKDMTKVSESIEKEIDAKRLSCIENKGNGEDLPKKYSIFKLRKMRIMFQQLNLLMYRQTYLKSSIYSEEEEAEVLNEDDQ